MNQNELKIYVDSTIGDDERREKYLHYIDNCYTNEIPVILNLKHLSYILFIEYQALANILLFPERYYREFSIPKRNGSLRQIDSPYPILYHIQRWILNNILEKITLHQCATGFIKKKSIVDNAKTHLFKKSLLKMDIKDFFPNIKINRIISIFQNLGYPNKISYYLAKLCCKNNSIPQGSPTSPFLSNIIAKRLDNRLFTLSKLNNINYTRYADDLAFSGDYIHYNIINFINKILIEEGFKPNLDKTKLIIGKGKKILTGLSISNNNITIPRKNKRKLRQDAYFILKFGVKSHIKHKISGDPIYLDRLIGKFSFWNFVEPDNQYCSVTLDKLRTFSFSINS
jgi:RNA-directed DNA polymerase